jgi:acyl-CoA dehydrogenase
MDIAYSDSERAQDLSDRVEAFVDTVVLPAERDLEPGEPISDERVDSLREGARKHDVYCPQIDEAYGGMGMDFIDALPAFEQAGRSLLGPPAMRVDAPDEGTMHTLELVGTDEQKERWLRPLVAGEMKSAFAMTEPMQGAGSDPKMLKTTAEKDGDEWVIEGHKWWTSQGSEADVFLVMARTDPAAHPYSGCSIILVPAGVDGIEIVRDVPALSDDVYEVGHSEVRFEGVRVPLENTLGPENEGFAVAQQRLGPARLTHCMRFSGMAQRSLDVATAYLTERDAFGSRLSEKQTLRQRIADAHIRIHAVRTMVRHAAERIAAGHEARIPVAMSKVFTANMVQEVVDLAVQCCGGAGISKDLPLADFYENLRFFRIGDGADEVHRRVIAREAFQEVDTSELDSLPRF